MKRAYQYHWRGFILPSFPNNRLSARRRNKPVQTIDRQELEAEQFFTGLGNL